eukprot:g39359.t1
MDLLVGAIGLGLPLLQSHASHKEAISQANEHHKRQIRLDVELARRDILQEMRDQKADRLETMLVLDTLMLGCCFAILVEGMPPVQTWRPLLNVFSVSLASSISLFFSSIWFVMKVQARMSRYNMLNPKFQYTCGKEHSTFHEYFQCHCNALARTSTTLYYAGVVAVLLCAGIVTYSRFAIKFLVREAGIIFCAILGVFFFSLIIFEFLFPTGDKVSEEDVKRMIKRMALMRQHFRSQCDPLSSPESKGTGDGIEFDRFEMGSIQNSPSQGHGMDFEQMADSGEGMSMDHVL